MNTTPMTKADLLSAAESQYKALRAALEGLDERQLTEVWLGVWSIKEIVAHISGWHRELGPALERMARGERPMPEGVSYDDADAWNAKFAAARARRPRALARGLHARRGGRPGRAVPAGEDRVEDRGPELGPPLQGARRPDPGVARREGALRVRRFRGGVTKDAG